MLKIFILGLFPVAFSYILESCHIFIISRLTISLAFVYLIFFFFNVDFCPSTVYFISVKPDFRHIFTLLHILQKQQPLLLSRCVFSSVSRVDATFVCDQCRKQEISHALYSSPVSAEFLRLLMPSQFCFDNVICDLVI